jgi:hypothetical protein
MVLILSIAEPIEGQKFIALKVIAKITFCGVFEMTVYDYMNWNPPTPEQIKNLKKRRIL